MNNVVQVVLFLLLPVRFRRVATVSAHAWVGWRGSGHGPGAVGCCMCCRQLPGSGRAIYNQNGTAWAIHWKQQIIIVNNFEPAGWCSWLYSSI